MINKLIVGENGASSEIHVSSSLRQGQILNSGFEILDVKELVEFEALGIWAKHQKSGAEVFHVYNNDKENLFSFAFATPPKDSTGAAHILEHSVLCGSQLYPLKDAFLVLARGSLKTYLNAWTSPDRTIFPASSVNEQDYFNIMSVYGDAIFRPILSEWTFMQEGHHMFFAPLADGDKLSEKLQISGVVYNEMKGAYSSLDSYAGIWSIKSIMQGTPYEFESGGDPDYIPDLSWEDLKEFHRTWYSPANCRIFLAGNIPTEKQLDFLDKNFFSTLPPGIRNKPVSKTKRWDSPKTFKIPCPFSAEQKPTVILSWLCGEVIDTHETLSLAALTDILLGHDGSPVTRKLIDSGLGEDLSPVSGFEGDLRETSFCAGLKGVSDPEAPEKVESLILTELERLEREGIPKEEVEAALLGAEFYHREIRRSGGPFSLVWMRRSFSTWLHGKKPWESLLFIPLLSELKQRLEKDERYFEKMIRHYFLDNPHRAKIIIVPEKGFLEEKEAALKQRLQDKEVTLSCEERELIKIKSEELERVQEKDDDPCVLAAIPHLSRADLSPKIESIKREYADFRGVPALVHPIFTNGISYVDLVLPLDVFSPAEYLWFPFFTRAIVSMGLPGLDYGEVSTLIARTAGGFYGMHFAGSLVGGAAKEVNLPTGIHDVRNRDWIVFRLKALDEKIGPSLDLVHRLVTEADFSDLKRLECLILEMKNDIDSSLAPSGHLYASNCSGRFFSRNLAVNELWAGLDQVFFVHELINLNISEISAKLKCIQTKLNEAGLLVNYTGAAPLEAEREIGKYFGSFGPPMPRNPASQEKENIFSLINLKPVPGKPEVFASPSLQVGFASITLKTEPFASPLHPAELVFAHQLNTGNLWEEIRMKGGAYGAFAQPSHMEGIFPFSTYRDPNPLASLKTLSAIISKLHEKCHDKCHEKCHEKCYNETLNKDELEKAVIGAYAKETYPQTPAEKGSIDFFRFVNGIEESHRAERLKGIINVTEEQIEQVKKRLANDISAALETNCHCPVIIAGKTEAEKAAAHLGVDVIELPV